MFVLLLFTPNGTSFLNLLLRIKKRAYNIDDEFNEKRKNKEDEIDRLLSKIGKNGLKDLSEKERKRLDELSKK